MYYLSFLSYLALLIQISFGTVSIAAGLYYVAELVEEYTNLAKKYIWWMNSTVTVLYVLLWLFENLPSYLILCGICAQIAHFVILKDFPFVTFTSPAFIAAVIFMMINHYFAFTAFANTLLTFSEVLAYFTIFLWLVPFALFVSLSANDNVLPTTTDERLDTDVVSNYFSKRKKYGLLSFFTYAKESLLPIRTKKGF